MNKIIVLEWTYTPPDYFEEPIHIVCNQYEMTIDNGKAEARIKPEYYDKDHKMRDVLHSFLNDRFLGVQILNHKPFGLSKPSMYRLYPDGRKDITIFAESGIFITSIGTVDIVITDKNGNVVADSKKERIAKKKKLAELATKFRSENKVVEAVLTSYNAAVKDPNNELVHLYEIREALSKEFGGWKAVCKKLNISHFEWKRFGQLANDEPLKQGRHRGKSLGALRDATESELQEVRDIARRLIENYLEYLDNSS